jgi:hypothetical protein
MINLQKNIIEKSDLCENRLFKLKVEKVCAWVIPNQNEQQKPIFMIE